MPRSRIPVQIFSTSMAGVCPVSLQEHRLVAGTGIDNFVHEILEIPCFPPSQIKIRRPRVSFFFFLKLRSRVYVFIKCYWYCVLCRSKEYGKPYRVVHASLSRGRLGGKTLAARAAIPSSPSSTLPLPELAGGKASGEPGRRWRGPNSSVEPSSA